MRAAIEKVDIGFAPDQADVILPDGIFTDARNVRFRDGAFEKVKGTEAVFGSLSATPIYSNYVDDGVNALWVYANENVVYGTNGTTHTKISSLTYSADPDLGYTGGAYHGFLILNDAVNPPQSWVPSLSNKLIPLVNWPTSTLCEVIRPFGDFLVALRCTESGTFNPRLIRWSHIGGVASLPSSWDFTDPTNRAGRSELGDSPDELVDCLPLRDNNIVYKRFNTYLMQPIGGFSVFQFRRVFSQSGLLSENCVKAFGSSHFAVTDHDVIVHDGSQAQSLADTRLRRWLFNRLSPTMFDRSFVLANYRAKEMWFCFPETGTDWPNLALCWDWSNNTFTVRDLGTVLADGASGIVSTAQTTFDNLVGTFQEQTGQFNDTVATPFASRLVLFDAEAKAAYQAEQGETLNGAIMTAYAIRDNIGLTKDVGSIKRVRRVFPKMYGTVGDVLNIYVGVRNTPDSAITYSGPFAFTIGTDYKVDCRVSGRFITVRFEAEVTNNFRCAGFDIEFDHDGAR